MADFEKSIFYYSALLIGAWLLGLAGESIYAPAMPAIAAGLNVPETFVKLTISYFIFGKTVSMFLCSPIAEVFGRRQFILAGLGLFIAGGLLCASSPDIHVLLAGRLLQGFGCSITILMGRSIVNDCFEGGYAAKVFSYIFTGNAIGIFILPVIGGYMAAYMSWRWIFLILSAYGAIILLLLWRYLPQTNPRTSFAAIHPQVIFKNYKTIMSSRALWGFLLCVAFMMAGEKAYTTSAAFLFMKELNFNSIEYGYLTSGIWAAHLSGTFLAGWLALRMGIDRGLAIGVVLIAVPSLVMLVIGVTAEQSMVIFVIMMLMYMFGTGFVIVSAAVGIVRPFPTLIGFATAFAMALEFGIASLISFLISYHSSSMPTIAKMVGSMGVLTLASWLIFFKRPWKNLL